ncbi:MAG: RnfH family protein [Gammaproteobacteria bacterium]|nr:RnfH family protein [Gammaproteobacteria bacterium]
MQVEVVFALPQRQVLLTVAVADGATVAEVLAASGISRQFPGHDLDALQAGIWGQPVERSRVAREGDRIELFRPLEMNPRESRRLKIRV